VLRIDSQMTEAVLAHDNSASVCRVARAREALVAVGIAPPDERRRAIPRSREAAERVAIAIALIIVPTSSSRTSQTAST